MVKRCLCVFLCLWLTVVAAAADGGQVLFDETEGESLSGLMGAEDTHWPVSALPVAGESLTVKAKGAVLMDQTTGRVLFEQGAKEPLPIASVTKVMTLLLVMEALDEGRIGWQDPVTCSERAASMGGSQIWLEPGEVMTVEELVKAAAVVSANDACAALAEHICGSIDAFVTEMNKRAAALGMEHTRFVDCSGLDDSGYSCAYDVAVMSRELMTHGDVERFTTIWMDSLRGGASQLVNTNKLVKHYNGATGLKTGTTNAAGHCLSATARREGTAFVAVVLGCATTADRWEGARTLLDYGFASYTAYTPEAVAPDPIPVRGGQQPQVAVAVPTPEALLIPKGQEGQITRQVTLCEDLQAPVFAGQTVGSWRLMLGEELLAEYPLCAAQEVAAVTLRWAYGLLLGALLG